MEKVLICNNCKDIWESPRSRCLCGCTTLNETHHSNIVFAKNPSKLKPYLIEQGFEDEYDNDYFEKLFDNIFVNVTIYEYGNFSVTVNNKIGNNYSDMVKIKTINTLHKLKSFLNLLQ